MSYATFGDLIFETPDTGIEVIDNEIGQDVATYELATGKPLAVFVGEKLRRLTIKVTLCYSMAKANVAKDRVKDFIAEIEKMVGSGQAYSLMLVSGVYQGSYLLVSVKDSIKETFPNGLITRYEATLELVEQKRQVGSASKKMIAKNFQQKKQETWESASAIIVQQKRRYENLMKSRKYINPLYAAYCYGKRVLF